MSEKDLEARFQEAVAIASQMTQSSLPQDVQLRLYAFYKQATFGTIEYNNSPAFDLRNDRSDQYLHHRREKYSVVLQIICAKNALN